MRYRALATDYDGTIATHGLVDEATLEALQRAREAGIKLLLVSGRELESLQRTFGRFDLFDLMVLENGGLLYEPATGREWPLCDPPPLPLVEALRERNVHPLSVGRVIVATFEPHDHTVLECIHRLGLEHQVIFNKGAVMILPSGVNKATGLKEALTHMGLDAERTVAVGDAENDHALLSLCGIGAAVANALPALKDHADYVCEADHGAGVAELIDHMLADTLRPQSHPELELQAAVARSLGDFGADVHPDA
jgi:hydroxymethylpyrimidine pyrophosphatase-like HAD family hydrolase